MSLLSRQPLFLAQLPVSPEPGNIVLTLGLIAILISCAAACVSIWYMTRRQPSVEQYVDREVTKLESRINGQLGQLGRDLHALRTEAKDNSDKLVARIERENLANAKHISSITKSLETSLQDLHRAIGRVEGKLNS